MPFLEKLVVGDVHGIKNGSGTLSVFTNEKGGIIDDTVITKAGCPWSSRKHYMAMRPYNVYAQLQGKSCYSAHTHSTAQRQCSHGSSSDDKLHGQLFR